MLCHPLPSSWALALCVVLARIASVSADDVPMPELTPQSGASEPETRADDDGRRQQVARDASQFCRELNFTTVAADPSNDQEPTRTELVREPILRWSNPTIGSVFGDVYLWTLDGRPAVVASWYRYYSPAWGRTLEVSLLGPRALQGEYRGTRFWSPQLEGGEFQALTAAKTPVATRSGRMTQMRQLADDFEVILSDTRVPQDVPGGQVVERSLRQLTRPLFRYDPEHLPAGCVDGALFAFVEGTDPELFLILEAWGDGAPELQTWHYTVARMNGDALEVRYRSEPVARFDALAQTQEQPAQSYTLFSLERPLSVSEE